MSTTFTGSVQIVPAGVLTNVLDLSSPKDTLGTGMTVTTALANGTGAGQANMQWHDERTLLTTAGETLDLTALAGGAFGTVNFSAVKALVIEVTTTTTGYRLEIGGDADNQFSAPFGDASDKIIVQANGQLALVGPVNGYTVDSTHKKLKIYNPSGGSVTYRIWIAGVGTIS